MRLNYNIAEETNGKHLSNVRPWRRQGHMGSGRPGQDDGVNQGHHFTSLDCHLSESDTVAQSTGI